MSVEPSVRRSTVHMHSRWAGTAFLLEAMLILICVVAAVAIIMQMVAGAVEQMHHSDDLAQAVALATSASEQFAADPNAVSTKQLGDDVRTVCEVIPEQRPGGTLYHATITVYDIESGNELYTMSTAKYESGVS